MREKGQGALEYLLLIGGAIVVAVIVVTLLLGVSAPAQGQTASASASSLCSQKAALVNNDCDFNGIGSGDGAAGDSLRVVLIGTDCYACAGNFPQCSASLSKDPAYDTPEACRST